MFAVSSQVAVGACAIPLAVLAWRFLDKYLDDYFIAKATVLKELESFCVPRPDGRRIRGTAVVCGGRYAQFVLIYSLVRQFCLSISGLWSARVCADHFTDVIIVEPESWVNTEMGKSDIYNATGERVLQEKQHVRSRVMQYVAVHGKSGPEVIS